MKTSIMKTLAAGIVAAVIVTSCSLEKRHYTSGYSVQWNSKKGNVSATEASYVAKQTPKKVIENNTVAKAPIEQVAANNNTVSKTLVASINKAVYTATTPKVTSFENTIANNNAKIVAKVATPSATKKATTGGSDFPVWAYVLLAILIPFVAVGIATDWGIEVLWNILWSFLCIAGIIHAFIILKRKGIL